MSAAETASKYRLNIEQIRSFLPHRAPFLLVDRVLSIEPKGEMSEPVSGQHRVGTRVTALKNITYNEPFFLGHFPHLSIVPGVLIIEMMAQAACFVVYPFFAANPNQSSDDFQCFLVGVDETRFRRPVVPGDSIVLEAEVTKCRGKLWGFHVKALVEGQVVAEADLLANMILRTEVQP